MTGWGEAVKCSVHAAGGRGMEAVRVLFGAWRGVLIGRHVIVRACGEFVLRNAAACSDIATPVLDGFAVLIAEGFVVDYSGTHCSDDRIVLVAEREQVAEYLESSHRVSRKVATQYHSK